MSVPITSLSENPLPWHGSGIDRRALNLKPLVPCLDTIILLHQSLSSLKERPIEGTDQHRRGWPQQLTIQRAVLSHGYADTSNFPIFLSRQ